MRKALMIIATMAVLAGIVALMADSSDMHAFVWTKIIGLELIALGALIGLCVNDTGKRTYLKTEQQKGE